MKVNNSEVARIREQIQRAQEVPGTIRTSGWGERSDGYRRGSVWERDGVSR